MNDAEKCQRCKKEDGTPELHTCPFAYEIHDDKEPRCNCCEDCTDECAMDI